MHACRPSVLAPVAYMLIMSLEAEAYHFACCDMIRMSYTPSHILHIASLHAVSVNVMCNDAGDLLGGEATAPAPAAGSAGGMFAGLDVGTSTNTSNPPPYNSGTPSTLTVPQSPFDALAGLQGPSPSHLGIGWHLAI